jgi:LuxR family maltose regulon positive regulatory protein
MSPRLRQDLVQRSRLLESLSAAAKSHPLVLISAPPGYGQTTLIASLLAASPSLPAAWISLDEEDNDPARFLTALVTF